MNTVLHSINKSIEQRCKNGLTAPGFFSEMKWLGLVKVIWKTTLTLNIIDINNFRHIYFKFQVLSRIKAVKLYQQSVQKVGIKNTNSNFALIMPIYIKVKNGTTKFEMDIALYPFRNCSLCFSLCIKSFHGKLLLYLLLGQPLTT